MQTVSQRLKQALRRLLGKPQAPAVIAQHPFDVTHGVDTSGLLHPAELGTSHGNSAHVTAYFGVPPSRFRTAIARWQATPGTLPVEQVRLIDVGCGKGRAVLLAAETGFRDVVGVELYRALAAVAERNLATWQRQRLRTLSPTTILCTDAATALPGLLGGATLLYVYNPFRAPVLRDVLQALLRRHASLTAPLDFLYLYPEHEAVFQEFPAFQRLWHEEIALDADDAGDGLSSATDPCSLYRLTPL